MKFSQTNYWCIPAYLNLLTCSMVVMLVQVIVSTLLIAPLAFAVPTDIYPNTTLPRQYAPEYAVGPPTMLKTPIANFSATVAEQHHTSGEISVKVVKFHGSSVFSAAQLQAVATPFLGRLLDSSDIEELRYRLTRLYVNAGYINSGAVIEGYDARSKSLRVRLQEGKLGAIHVNTKGMVRPSYVAERLRIAGVSPLNVSTLQERFLTLLDDPVIDSVRGAIGPSPVQGEATLEANAVGKRPYTASITWDNHGSVSREERALLSGTLRNLTGLGELLTLNGSLSAGNDLAGIRIDLPVSYYDTRLHASYEHSNSVVGEEDINILHIKGNYYDYEFGLNQPLLRTPQQSLLMGLSLGQRSNTTTLLGIPFCFT